MSRESVTLRGRRFVEQLMLDHGTVTRATGDVDPLTGQYAQMVVYEGRMSVETYEPYQVNPEIPGASLTVQRYAVKVPVGSFAPQVGDVAEVTQSVLDPYLVGRKLRVVALLHKTAATAYRLGVEEIV